MSSGSQQLRRYRIARRDGASVADALTFIASGIDAREAKLKLASKGEIVAALHEACGREVLIVTSGVEGFGGESGPAAITPDQPGLRGIGDEYDEAA